MTRITDPDTAQVNYQHDRTGRVTAVTGAGAGSAPVYVSAIQYRAWGAARRVTYGNNIYADVEYNTRLQPTRFEVGGANPQHGSTTVMRSLYSYYADGRIRFVDDDTQANSPFDRAYSFDHVGRTQAAYTGGQARNFNQNLTGGTTDGPYHHTYQHDEWDNMTSRTARYWSQWSYFAATPNARNQHPNWLYDAAGNLVRDDTRNYLWDAAGRNTRSAQIAQPASSLEQSFDGDGRRVKRVETWPYGLSAVNYYVRSSVVGGREIVETDGQGNRQTGYVYMGGEVLATSRINGVSWMHRDPVTGSRRGSGVDGNPYGVVELDPEGVDVGQYDPFLYGEGGADKGVASFRFEDGSWMGDCTLDGIASNCAWLREMAEMGVAVVAPEQTTQWDYETGRFEFFRAFGDGYSGFIPQGHGYLGQGITAPLGHISRVGSDRLLHALLAEGGARTLSFKPQQNDGFNIQYLSPVGSEGIGQEGMDRIRREVDDLRGDLTDENSPCARALKKYGLYESVIQGLRNGVVIGSSQYLRNPRFMEAAGLTEAGYNDASGRIRGANGVTVHPEAGGTTDPRHRVFINSAAFRNSNLLRETIVHEFLHVAELRGRVSTYLTEGIAVGAAVGGIAGIGVGARIGGSIQRFRSHDLSYTNSDPRGRLYDDIIAACR